MEKNFLSSTHMQYNVLKIYFHNDYLEDTDTYPPGKRLST